MGEMVEDEWEEFCSEFDNSTLLDSISCFDFLKDSLSDQNTNAIALRKNLVELYDLSRNIIEDHHLEDAKRFFSLAENVDMQIFSLTESLETIQRTLIKIAEYYPEELLYEKEEQTS